MKKIINGKKYDTETAKNLGCYSNGVQNEFCYFCETLYQTETGEFFLHGNGNYGSKYAIRADYGWNFEEKIIPLTAEAAQQWTEDHLGENRKRILRRFFIETNGFNMVVFADEYGKAYIFHEERFDKPLTLDYAKKSDFCNIDGCETAEEIAMEYTAYTEIRYISIDGCETTEYTVDDENLLNFADVCEGAEEIIEF